MQSKSRVCFLNTSGVGCLIIGPFEFDVSSCRIQRVNLEAANVIFSISFFANGRGLTGFNSGTAADVNDTLPVRKRGALAVPLMSNISLPFVPSV